MSRRNLVIVTVLTLSFLALGGFRPAIAQGEGESGEKSLYERLGGLAPISVVVSDFVDALVPDSVMNENPAIDAARERVPAAYLKYHVTAMVCQATGGPCQYHGGVTIFKEVLAKHKVPEKETQELLEILGSTKADIVASEG